MITSGFGTTFDFEHGTQRRWVIGRDGVKRWADTGEACKRCDGEIKSNIEKTSMGLNWLSIETCPINVDVLIGGGCCPYVQINSLRKAGTRYLFAGLGDAQQPSHWMPLPEQPEKP